MLIGGIMGVIKGFFPNVASLSFRNIFGLGSTFKESAPAYAVIYGTVMAVLEIVSAILLLVKRRISIIIAAVILSVNSAGCIAAVILGDLTGILSLLFRLIGLYILYINKEQYRIRHNV
jgi:hypothetical protein